MRVVTVHRRLIGTFVAAALLALPGPVAAQEAVASPAPSAVPAETGPNGNWDVAALDPWAQGLVEPGADTTLSVALLSDGRLEGETGCGRYEGGYFQEGELLSMGVVSPPFGPCGERQRAASTDLLAALDAVDRWQIGAAGSGLELLDASGRVRLILERPTEGDAFGEWLVTAYVRPNGKRAAPSPDHPMILALSADGRVSGSTGCRFFEGQHRGEGDGIVIGPIELIGRPCEGALRKPQRQLLAALEEVARWERAGDTLRLIDAFEQPMVELQATDAWPLEASPAPAAASPPASSTPEPAA